MGESGGGGDVLGLTAAEYVVDEFYFPLRFAN